MLLPGVILKIKTFSPFIKSLMNTFKNKNKISNVIQEQNVKVLYILSELCVKLF